MGAYDDLDTFCGFPHETMMEFREKAAPEFAQMIDERRKKLEEKWGTKENGKCGCAYCRRDVDAIGEHAGILEMDLFSTERFIKATMTEVSRELGIKREEGDNDADEWVKIIAEIKRLKQADNLRVRIY